MEFKKKSIKAFSLKKRAVIISVLLMTAVLSGLGGCGNKTNTADQAASASSVSTGSSEDILGSWKGTGDEISTITFKSDGTCKDDAGDIMIAGPYSVDVSAGTISVYDEETGLSFVYSYMISGDELTLQTSFGRPRTFKKQ